MEKKLFVHHNKLLRLFLIFTFIGVPLFWFVGYIIYDIENALAEPGKAFPLGYISSVMFLTNFSGMFIAAMIFLLVLREKEVLSFLFLLPLAVFVDFFFAPSDNPVFFHSLWGSFLKVFGAKGHILGIFSSFVIWILLKRFFVRHRKERK